MIMEKEKRVNNPLILTSRNHYVEISGASTVRSDLNSARGPVIAIMSVWSLHSICNLMTELRLGRGMTWQVYVSITVYAQLFKRDSDCTSVFFSRNGSKSGCPATAIRHQCCEVWRVATVQRTLGFLAAGGKAKVLQAVCTPNGR